MKDGFEMVILISDTEDETLHVHCSGLYGYRAHQGVSFISYPNYPWAVSGSLSVCMNGLLATKK